MEHCERIGPALWEFVWLLDKITAEKDGKGIVLGGAPVKIERIAQDLNRCDKTIRTNLDRLQDKNYIKRTRTPFGFTIKVLNSRKFGIWGKKVIGNNYRSLPERSVENYRRDRQQLPEGSVVFYRNKEDSARNTAKNGKNGAVTHSVAVVDSSPNTPPRKTAATERTFPAFGFDTPFGHPKFQSAVVRAAEQIRNGNILAIMESVIVELGGKVPPEWYRRKHDLEKIALETSVAPSQLPETDDLSPKFQDYSAATVLRFERAAKKYPAIAQALRKIARMFRDRVLAACDSASGPDLNALEREIAPLDAEVYELLQTAAGNELTKRIRRETRSQLIKTPRRAKMNPQQLSLLEAQHVQRIIWEKFGLPRLSAYYMV